MTEQFLIKLAADAPILLVLLLVLWKGGQKLDKIGERLDRMTLAVKNLSSKIELVGKIQDMRLELHEERTASPAGNIVDVSAVVAARRPNNGAMPISTQITRPSWPAVADSEDE